MFSLMACLGGADRPAVKDKPGFSDCNLLSKRKIFLKLTGVDTFEIRKNCCPFIFRYIVLVEKLIIAICGCDINYGVSFDIVI